MRIGLFGGSFDPPHRAHLAIAEAVRKRFALDRVLLAPAAIQPLKPNGAHAGFNDRLRMVELLCEGAEGIDASTIDGPQANGKPNYTIDTIRRLHDAIPGAEIFVIVGADSFLGIREWKDPDALMNEARWIVVSRPGFDLHALDALRLTKEQREHIDILTDFADPVSATEIRERLSEHEASSHLVPAKVLEYIRAHRLYET